ncbi:MAG TPA: hypothetical protein VD863_26010 [Bradyrhizobium sp.]|nr:hypothetical protein [Bradyrhizobium sp.]
MNFRTQIKVDPELQRRAHAKAAALGISFAEYVRRLLASDLGPQKERSDISLVFDIVDEGPVTNIAADKDKMVGEAVWHEHTRAHGKGAKRRTTAKVKIKRN